MPELFAGAKAAIKAGKALIRLDKAVSKGSVQDRFDESERRLNRNISQVTLAVCRSLVAIALGRPPDDEEVDAYMAAAVDDPTFPARAHQLLGAMRKTGSEERLRMLATMLFGLPFMKTTEADRERVDILVERLMPDDVKLLDSIHRTAATAEGCCFAMMYNGLRLFPGLCGTSELEHMDEAIVLSSPPVSFTSFDALQLTGCIYIPDKFSAKVMVNGQWAPCDDIEINPLGYLLLEALADVHADILGPGRHASGT